MDFFRFVNSKAIREHLEALQYEFTALEAAWLVYQCKGISFQIKKEAWNFIIDNMPDDEITRGASGDGILYLHHFLKEYIQHKERLIADLESTNEEAVYQYKTFCAGEKYSGDYNSVYKTFDECWQSFEEYQEEDVLTVWIKKLSFGDENEYIEAEYTKEHVVRNIIKSKLSEEEASVESIFESQWFDFPVPFEKGDVVYERIDYSPALNGGVYNPFVLDSAVPLARNIEWYSDWQKNGCNYDMKAWGYFQNEDGRIFHEIMNNYMDLEYFTDRLEERQRLLFAIGNYMKNRTGLEVLLTCYRKTIVDEFAKDNMLINWYTDEALELAGILEFNNK